MNSSPEDFNDLRRLLALKRHEQPPPGYFRYLPNQIISRIEREERAAQSTWWQWFAAKFDAKPVFACTYGFAVSALLVMGFRLSQILGNESGASLGSEGSMLAAATADPVPVVPGAFAQTTLNPHVGLVSYSQSGPAIQESGRRFSAFNSRASLFQKANFIVTP